MGRASAEGMKEWLSKEQALVWHLQYNHYPPVPLSLVKPCRRAIDYANKNRWNVRVRLPEGCTWKGQKSAPVWALVDTNHLESFLDEFDE